MQFSKTFAKSIFPVKQPEIKIFLPFQVVTGKGKTAAEVVRI